MEWVICVVGLIQQEGVQFVASNVPGLMQYYQWSNIAFMIIWPGSVGIQVREPSSDAFCASYTWFADLKTNFMWATGTSVCVGRTLCC